MKTDVCSSPKSVMESCSYCGATVEVNLGYHVKKNGLENAELYPSAQKSKRTKKIVEWSAYTTLTFAVYAISSVWSIISDTMALIFVSPFVTIIGAAALVLHWKR